MDWLQFISAVIGHIAWPIVILVVIFAVRKHLGSLAERILELSFGGATVKFDKLLTKGAEIIELAPVPELPKSIEPELPLPPAPDQVKENQHPPGTGKTRAAITNILVAFEAIESLLEKIGHALGVNARGAQLIRMLVKRELIPDDLLELYNTLRLARNAAVHENVLPSKAQVSEYIRQALYLLDSLQVALVRIAEGKPK